MTNKEAIKKINKQASVEMGFNIDVKPLPHYVAGVKIGRICAYDAAIEILKAQTEACSQAFLSQ